MSETGHRRLGSWKEIAAYLGRDVRTVLRWEKERALPVHRPPGETGRVVFAYTNELDAWLTAGSTPPVFVPAVENVPVVSHEVTAPVRRARLSRWWIVGASVLTLALSGAAVWTRHRNEIPTRVKLMPDSIVATGAGGTELWRYPFPPDENGLPMDGREPSYADVLPDRAGVIVGTSLRLRLGTTAPSGGQLLWFDPRGTLTRTFEFTDTLAFRAGEYGPPWTMTDVRVDPASRGHRVAVAAHHLQWWPSVVTILDDKGRQAGTWVNAGWIERLHWVGPDRLVIAGFSNEQDAGMIALLDTHDMNGQLPSSPGAEFWCPACGGARPLRLVVLPRSEVNRASGSPFNRAELEPIGGHLIVRTVEVPASGYTAVDALYEFTPSLELVRASYSDRYWETHRELEQQGRIQHTRAQCPARGGPPVLRTWEAATGWVEKRLNER